MLRVREGGAQLGERWLNRHAIKYGRVCLLNSRLSQRTPSGVQYANFVGKAIKSNPITYVLIQHANIWLAECTGRHNIIITSLMHTSRLQECMRRQEGGAFFKV